MLKLIWNEWGIYKRIPNMMGRWYSLFVSETSVGNVTYPLTLVMKFLSPWPEFQANKSNCLCCIGCSNPLYQRGHREVWIEMWVRFSLFYWDSQAECRDHMNRIWFIKWSMWVRIAISYFLSGLHSLCCNSFGIFQPAQSELSWMKIYLKLCQSVKLRWEEIGAVILV